MKLGLLMTTLCIGSLAIADPAITDVTAKQRYPWNGKVDICYTVSGIEVAAQQKGQMTSLKVTAKDNDTDTTYTASTLTGNTSLADGTHAIIWDMSAQGLTFKSTNIVFDVRCEIDYCGVQLWENGPYWAEQNIGATKPEEYGYYFCWGDTVGAKRNESNNGWVSVKDGAGCGFNDCPTVGLDLSSLRERGYIDSTTNLVATHDAATAHLGAPWRMPTDAEFSALISNCDTTWTTRGGVYGRLVMGRGAYASKSIFLPAAGYGSESGLYCVGSVGVYWSSTSCLQSYSWYLNLSDFSRAGYGGLRRYYGQPVRPLREADEPMADVLGSSSPVSIDLRRMTTGAVETLRDGLEAYYPLNGDLLDYSAHGRNVDNDECVGIEFAQGRSRWGQIALFDGSTYGRPSDVWAKTNDVALAFWFCATTNISDSSYAIFPAHGGNDDVTSVGARCGTNGIHVVEHKGGLLKATLKYDSDLGDGWRHVVITVGASYIKLYVDGILVAEGTGSDNNKKLECGCTFGGGSYGCFVGSMSDVCYYSRTLSAREVSMLYSVSQSALMSGVEADATVAADTERITYSPLWETSEANAQAFVAINGVDVQVSNESGVYEWTPTRNGTYMLTHKVEVAGSQVGETLSATFLVEGLNPETPVISPESGTIFDTTSLSVSMSCASEGATIHYTTDGSVPTMESPVYKRFRIDGKTTVKAIAFYEDGTASEMAIAEYAKGRCEDPIISLADGTVFQHSNQQVSISYGAEGVLRFTLDGADPTTESPVYEGPFTISETTTVKAKVFSDSFFDSQVVTSTLTREWVAVATPVITAACSFIGSKTKAEISCATPDALIRYTTNGNEPNSHSTKYTGPFDVTSSCTIKAYAVREDYTNSEVASFDIEKIWGVGDSVGSPDQPFTTSGNATWVRDATVSQDGSESIRSGNIGNGQKSVLTTVISGKGTVSFYWKTSCEEDEEEHEWDHAEFAIDGVEKNRLDGISDWQNVSYELTTDGDHTLTWTYVKDDVESVGDVCAWMDAFVWTPVPSDPIPELPPNATPNDVTAALVGSGDTRLTTYITSVDQYNAYRTWATEVEAVAGGLAGQEAVKSSEYSWLSYALDSAVLLEAKPQMDDLTLEKFAPSAADGQYDFTIDIDGISVGGDALGENLATIFGLEGGTSLDSLSAGNVELTFGTPTNGKVNFTAGPKNTSQSTFFMRVKFTP